MVCLKKSTGDVNITKDEKRLFSIKEFAYYIGVSERTARKMIAAPACPYVCKIGGRILVDRYTLDKWIDNNTGK